ncbi:MAG: ABC transporter permease [SAR324 cluster bacterium]|nr:ABC transporter permease [SAR324 cluster bacterium]
MNPFHYLKQELYHRFGRSVVTLVSIALVVFMAVALTAISRASTDALRLPLENVGADIVVQLSGDIPQKLEGLVFPHPTAQLPAEIVKKIKKLHGVIRTTGAVFLWDLSPNKFQSLLGVDSEGSSGIPGLNSQLISGKPLDPESRPVEALVDGDFAAKNKMKVGDQVELQGQSYRISGTVDTPKSGNIMRADIYLPLAEAQLLSSKAPWIIDLYPFTPADVNLLFLEVDQRELGAVSSAVEKMLGDKAIVSSEISIQEELEDLMFLSDQMSIIFTAVVALLALALLARSTVTAIGERRRDLAILQAVGWTRPRIITQLSLETAVLSGLGGLLGLLLAWIGISLIGNVELAMELSWEISPSPHFLPETDFDRTRMLVAPIQMPLLTAVLAWIIGVMAAVSSAVLAGLKIVQPNPWRWLAEE